MKRCILLDFLDEMFIIVTMNRIIINLTCFINSYTFQTEIRF
jgi:hypothetical protein